MFDFLVEIQAMNREIDEENRANEQRQREIEQMRTRYGRR